MNNFNKITGLAIVAVLALSPAFASARNSNSDKKMAKEAQKEAREELREEMKEKREEMREEMKEKKEEMKEEAKKLREEIGDSALCGSYFNRFFTYGWMKWSPFWTNGVSMDADSFEEWVKSGCNPKPRPATTTDVTAPVISNVSSVAFRTIAFVTWNTDEKSDSVLYYSTSSPVEIATAPKITKSALTKDHWVLLFGLAPDATYYAVVSSKDKAGNTATSSQFSWNTGSPSPTPDTSAPIISSISTSAGTSTASVSWQTNEAATSKVYYSTSTPLDIASSTTLQISNSSFVTSHTMLLTGLATGTPYYLKVESRDASNNTATSSQFSFTTSGI